MTVRDRLKSFIKEEKIGQAKFEKSVSLSNGYVNNIRNSIQPDKIERIKATYPQLNVGWLLTGEGEMLRSKRPIEARLVSDPTVMMVPLVGQYAYAGFEVGFSDDGYMETLPTMPFIVDHMGKGNYIAIEVKGDSMDDGSANSYLQGDILLCRKIPEDLWAESRLHLRRWDFVVVTEEGILVKQITQHDMESHTLTLHSLNNLYEDQTMPMQQIRAIYNVIQSVRPRGK